MTQLQLFAITEQGPQPLPAPADATDFADLYTGLDLGVYSVLRTFEHNKFLDLDAHLARTVRSIRGLGWDYELDQTRLRRALHRLCTDHPAPETRVRIDVLAAPAHPLGTNSRELIALMPFTPPPPALYREGVTLAFAEGVARAHPDLKTADFASARQRIAAANAAYEYLLVNPQREILEGTSSNFYGVRDGGIYTAGEGVLAGITRRILLALAREHGIPVRLEPVTVDQVAELDEAAISSSSRGLLPVVNIAGQTIGDGRPGPICRTLMTAYDAYVREAVRPAVAEQM
jgi:branched-chain amino acid aminotransferase